MPTPDEDAQHREEMRKAYQKRLRLLELRAAYQGEQVEPSVLIEIDKIKNNLAGLDLAEVQKPAPEVQANVERSFENDKQFLIAQFASLTRRQNDSEAQLAGIKTQVTEELAVIKVQLDEVVTNQAAAATEREATTQAIAEVKTAVSSERERRIGGQRLNLGLLIATVLFGLVSFAYVLWVLF